ncbi:MAG: hypothetical protein GXP14_17450 [Gammaproteobacteria bacterium]|nr:hypothetical protein [Gammaproteobacteria bacterium]
MRPDKSIDSFASFIFTATTHNSDVGSLNSIRYLFLSFILSFTFALSLFGTPLYAADFTQTDWGGGSSAANAISPSNQTGWNNYSSKTPTTLIVNGGSDLKIDIVTDAITQNTSDGFKFAPATFVRHTSKADFSTDSTINNTAVLGNAVLLDVISLNPGWTKNTNFDAPGNNSPNNYYTVALGDLDNDGDLDLIRGERFGWLRAYINTGSNTVPNWVYNSSWNVGDMGFYSDATLADLDGDGDLDLLAGQQTGTIRAYRNIGNVNSPLWEETPAWGISVSGFFSRPELADLDGDGDFDLLIGVSNNIYGFRNEGDNTEPVWLANPDWNISGLSNYNAPAFADFDGDGDVDLMVGHNTVMTAFENTGVSTAIWTANAAWDATSVTQNSSVPAFGDLDGDGDQDLLVADYYGNLYGYENTGTIYNASGDFVSTVIDTGIHADYTTLDYTANIPTNTLLTVDIRAGDTPLPDGTWTGWQTGIINGADISTLLGNKRYSQYRLNLSTSDPGFTPSFTAITFNFSNYASGTNVIASDDSISSKISFIPTELGLYSSPKSMRSVQISGNYAFAVDDSGNSTSRFHSIDISDPSLPTSVASITLGNRIYDAFVVGSYAYTAVAANGLVVVDISNPLVPVVVKTVDTPGSAYAVYVVGNYAYVADLWGGLQIVDISTPASAFLVGSGYDTPGIASDVFVLNDTAYIADGSSGLQIFNIANPASPQLMANYPGTVSRVAVIKDVAYLIGLNSGLSIINISDPADPQLLAFSSDVTNGNGIHVVGDYAYITDVSNNQLKIIDISNSYNPLLETSFATSSGDLQVSGKYAYIANGTGLQVISLGDYMASGIYYSSILDAGSHVGFTSVDYLAAIPPNTTLNVSVRSGNTVMPENGGWTAWQTLMVSGGDISGQGSNRYLQYKVDLSSSDSNVTAKLDSITVNYNRYFFATTITSSAFNTTFADNLLGMLSWNETLPTGTDVRLQVRSAADNLGVPGTWSDWQGPDSTASSYWNSINSFSGSCSGSGVITCASMANTLRDGINDQWLQYQITLVSSGDNSPTLSAIILNYVTATTSGITVTPTMTITSEATLSASTFAVSLASAPSNDVTLSFYSTDLSEGSVTPSSLTFTSADWASKIVTITPANDDIDDGDIVYSIVTTAAMSADLSYHNVNPDDVLVTNNDDDITNVNISPASGLSTTESGGAAIFSVRLTSQPVADVTIPFSSSDSTEATLSPASLIFTATNWNSWQTITVTGVDDNMIDGNIGYTIVTAAAISSDPAYGGFNAVDVSLNNTDDDTAALVISPSGTLSVSESGGFAPYTLALSSQPASNVTFMLSSSDLSEGSIFEFSMTFTPSNWNVPQTSTIYGRNDQEIDGDINFNITTGAFISADSNFNGVNPADVPVSNVDDDGYIITVTPTTGLITTEGGGQAWFNIKLGTQPSSDVTIMLTSSDPTEGRVPVSVVLSPNDISWRGKQVVITGLDDDEFDGDKSYSIITSAAISSDAGFNGIDPDDVSVLNQDNNFTVSILESNQQTISSYYLNYGDNNALSSAGDVNGDGYPDLIVGAETYKNGQTREGRAFVYYGSATGYNNTPDWTAELDISNAYFGSSVAGAGDVNGDGFDDVIVGASEYGNGQFREGAAFLYYGSATGLSTSPDWTAESDQSYAYFGNLVNTAGDINGDGYADIIVGAPLYNVTNTDDGRVYLYYGSNTGPSLSPDWVSEGNQAYMRYGEAIATAGDVNNDGFDDLLIGGSQYSNGELREGMVNLFYGSLTGPSTVSDWSYEGNQINAWFGSSVNSAGDVNGDGYMDVIIGAKGYKNTLWGEGRAYVFHGSADGLSLVPDWTMDGKQAYANLSSAVASSGDINNDGFDDVIVSFVNYDTLINNVGRSEIYFGSLSGLSTTPGWERNGAQLEGYFGSSVTSLGDVNQDGYADFAIGSSRYDNGQTDEGAVFVYMSKAQTTPRTLIVSSATGLTTGEGGNNATFSAKLSYAPTANVVIPVATDDATEGTVSPASLIFTPQNWFLPQTVLITGVDDALADGDVLYNVAFGAISSGDSTYSATVPDPVAVTNIDNERMVNLIATDGIAGESGPDKGTFTVSHSGFTYLPLTVNYTISGTASSGLDFQALSGSVTIPGGYSTTTVTITPIDDSDVEGNESIILSLVSGSDYVIDGAGSDTVTLGDNDSAGVIVSPTTGLTTTEAGGISQFYVVLTSRPSSNVNILLASNDTSEGAPTPSQLIFTKSNWGTAQSVIVAGADDTISDGDLSYSILTSVSSSDVNYSAVNPSDVSITNQDDDAAGNSNVKIGALTATISEGSGTPGIFRITRSGPTTSSLLVNFNVSGSSTPSLDYSALGSVITIPAGSKQVDLVVTSNDDTLFETDETIIVTLQSGSAYLVDRPSAATMTLLDDEQLTPPSVNFTINSVIEEGANFTLTANLSKEALTYPVTIPYSISGSALNPSDHDAANGSLVIASGLTGSVIFTTVNDGFNEADETVVFTMGTPINGVIGARNIYTVTITELNVMPAISLTSAQNGVDARIIVTTGGEVTITSNVTDANVSDTHVYDWSLTNNNLIDSNLDGDPATFVFSPNSVLSGYYNIVLKVDDDGLPSLSTTVEMLLEIVAFAPILTTEDSDGDGMSDDLESYDDSDGDGIADYLDAANLTSNQLQAVDGVSGNYIIETEPGLSLRLGAVAFAATADGAEVSLNDITDFGGGEGTAGVDPNDGVANTGGYFDYEIWGLPQEGQSAMLVIPQFNPIPNNAIYRKYFGLVGWQNFVTDSFNSLASAAGAPGVCPPPGDNSYVPGLTAGHFCIQLMIQDGGPNDTDAIANHVIADPGTLSLSTLNTVQESNEKKSNLNSNSGGGLMNSWLLLLLFIFLFKNKHRCIKINPRDGEDKMM